MENFDIQVTFRILAKTEEDAEQTIQQYLKNADRIVGCPDLIDWEFTEFIPADLKNSCCC